MCRLIGYYRIPMLSECYKNYGSQILANFSSKKVKITSDFSLFYNIN